MESSPLISAHDHARAASIATQTSDTTVAINEHALAAGEFANAAQNTTSVEALRTLSLLEQHHRKLSELLRLALEQSSQQSSSDGDGDGPEDEKQAASGKAHAPSAPPREPAQMAPPSSSPSKPIPTLSTSHRRFPARELSSSIASNLASARGIKSKYRGQPLLPSISNDQAPGSVEVPSRHDAAIKGPKEKQRSASDGARRPSWVPPAPQHDMAVGSEASGGFGDSTSRTEDGTSSRPKANDEGYSRFYSTFGSLINKLSAPLAFAGLPLVADEPAPEPTTPATPASDSPTAPRKTRQRALPASAEPDLTKIYSQATLRALSRDGHGVHAQSVADSFCWVPPSGHTATYANILTFDQKEKRRLAASTAHLGGASESSTAAGRAGSATTAAHAAGDFDDDGFVDARESQYYHAAATAVPASLSAQWLASLPPSVRKRVGGGGRAGARGGEEKQLLQKLVEELYTENASLKEMLDRLSRRLHAFELNSQSSHLALAQSLRLQRPGSPSPLAGSGGPLSGGQEGGSTADEELRRRNQELESQLARAAQQTRIMEQDNAKLTQTLDKYRDRWEKLKASAKARRGAQASPADGGDTAAASPRLPAT